MPTPTQVQALVLDHWWTQHRKQVLKLSPEQIRRESMAQARLALSEMQDLQAIGLDERTAWSEARRLALVPPPSPEELDEEA